MSTLVTLPQNRRVTAVTLAQYASKTLVQESLIRRLFQYPKDTLDQLCLSHGDPAKTLLRWSHSPLLGGEEGLQTFDCARFVWGDEQTAALAIAATSLGFYQPDAEIYSYRRSDLVLHQFATACACDMLAGRCQLNRAQAFLAGAMHDIGLLIFEKLARSRFCFVLSELDVLTTTSSVEFSQFGCDHASVGAELLRLLGANEEICEAIRWHHQPMSAPMRHQKLAAILSLANFLASRLGHTSLGVNNCPAPLNEALAVIGLRYRELAETVQRLVTIFPQVEQLL
jgi:HD-like signal output (HDOD) protein